jgi:phosphoglycolate phosphatase-like HAD superfamily hydrolase
VTAWRGVAIELDGALGDTRPLWEAWLSSSSTLLGLDPATLPRDRVAAARVLDHSGTGNWKTLLERYSEDRVALYVRRNPEANAALRALKADGHPLGVFTDAPEPLARVALAQLGVRDLISALYAGESAPLELLRVTFGGDLLVARTTDELVRYASMPAS